MRYGWSVKRRRYPLDPLRSLRDAKVRAETQELGRRIQSRQQAEQAHARAEADRQVRQDAVTQEQRAERDQLESGALRAADLDAQARWSHGQEIGLAALRERERQAAEQLAGERQREAKGQHALAQAEHAAQLVQKHHGRWHEAERARAEAAAEDEALDVHVARAHGAKARGAT